MADEFVKLQVSSNKVVVFSKSYCPYCKKAKAAIKEAGLSEFYVIELDERDDGDAIQDALLKITGARSVGFLMIHLLLSSSLQFYLFLFRILDQYHR